MIYSYSMDENTGLICAITNNISIINIHAGYISGYSKCGLDDDLEPINHVGCCLTEDEGRIINSEWQNGARSLICRALNALPNPDIVSGDFNEVPYWDCSLKLKECGLKWIATEINGQQNTTR